MNDDLLDVDYAVERVFGRKLLRRALDSLTLLVSTQSNSESIFGCVF